MLKIIRRHPSIDLATVRETVSYMQDDAANTPGMERIAAAFEQVLREIEAAEGVIAARRDDAGASRFFAFRR